MSDIVLSSGVRQNLLSLQSTAQLMSMTQNRLATGKKVNSALDNPSNFFTSQALNNRASDLNSLLDSIGQAQQTLKAADSGITSLTKLVESAKSIAKQAQQAPKAGETAYAAHTMNSTIGATETLATHTGGAITAADSTLFSFTLDVGGGAVTVGFTSGVGATIGDIQSGLIADFNSKFNTDDIELVVSGNGLRVNAKNADVDFTVGAGAGNSGLTAAAYNSTSLLDNIVTAGGAPGDKLTITRGSADPLEITFGTGTGEISTIAELNAVLQGGNLGSAAGVSLKLTAGSSSGAANTIQAESSSAGLATALGLASQDETQTGTATPGAPNATRTSLEKDFNDILKQIDALTKDASYNGINLLNGDDFKVVFNEDGSSSLTIKGVTFDSAGLGLEEITAGDFQDQTLIEAEIGRLDAALATLRNQASQFGSNLTTVQIRQDFTKSLINTLQTGADNLVLADTNEEGANLLALQTRQQLSTTALSMAAQADQAVLRLFG